MEHETVKVLRELLEDYKDACMDWTPEHQEYGQGLIERSEAAIADLEDEIDRKLWRFAD